ncbi:hypothetical protein D9S35_18400 [Escherichia coli]|nr:hypothetical protein [Escherichia coli]EEW4122739.1 hypothetical protein [Escherichia coli]EEW4134200.1 hypothetical protein [Escherichia coli]EEW4137138.1 hypothetical protein [Escherichia coli]EEW4142723.1 hypothetical protein [Escherichia coli]
MVPGASRCLAKVAHQTGGYPQKVDCQPHLNPRALSRIHHNAKDSLWLKILSCYVPAFSHIRRGGPGYSPTTRIRLIWLSPTTQKEKKCPVISTRCTNPTVKMLESIGALKSVG